MIGKPEDDIAPLEAARKVLEARLSQDENWRALQQLESREASGEPIVAVASSRVRATLIAALEHNRAFRAHRALRAAILALRGEDEQAQPSTQETDAQPGRPASRPRTANLGTTPVTNGHAVNGATSPQTHSHHTNAISGHGNSVPTSTLKIATPTPTATKSAKRPPTAHVNPAKADSDDLTRIWNIGNDLATRLNTHGITTWQQIAEWRTSDVKAISSALSLDRQIQKDGWIEQAALLHQRQSGAGSAPMPLCLHDPSARLPTVQAEALETKQADQDLALTPKPVPQPSVDAPPQVTPPTVRDTLDSIRGIDGALAKRLAELGVTSFAQIAEWRNDDIQTVNAKLDLGGRIAQQNWIEQAALLQTGQLTVHAQSLASAGPKIVTRPRRLALRTTVAIPKLSPPRTPTPQVEEKSSPSVVSQPLTTPSSTSGLPAALAKLGITDARVVSPSHGLHQANDKSAAAAASDEPEKASTPSDQQVPAPAVRAASDAVDRALAEKIPSGPTPGTEPPDEPDLQPLTGEKAELIVVEKLETVAEEPSEDSIPHAPTLKANRPNRPDISSRKSIPGINAELAQTLADIDRLSDETEALLGNSRREPPTPPGALRDNDPLSSGTTGSDLSCEEADVIIVSHDKPTPRQTLAAVATRHAQRPSFRKIVKYPNPARQIGGSQAAVHRNALDEASVEIVEHGGTRPGQSAGNTAAVAKQQHAGSIRRFLRALSGE